MTKKFCCDDDVWMWRDAIGAIVDFAKKNDCPGLSQYDTYDFYGALEKAIFEEFKKIPKKMVSKNARKR